MTEQLDLLGLDPDRRPCPTCNGAGTVSADRLVEQLDAPAVAHRDGPDTSKAAAALKFGTQRFKTLDRLVAAEAGATATELWSAIYGDTSTVPVHSIGSRLTEMKGWGWVEVVTDAAGSPVTRPTRRGNPSEVHRVTSLGRLAHSACVEAQTEAMKAAWAAQRDDVGSTP